METKQVIRVYAAEWSDVDFELPYVGKIRAGFASPAADYQAEGIDLNKLIIKNKNYTFIGKVEGTSMVDALLNDGDLVIIDRSLEPRHNDKVLVYIDGGFTIKFVSVDEKNKKVWLVPANGEFPRVEVAEGSDVRIWGVVTYSITRHRR